MNTKRADMAFLPDTHAAEVESLPVALHAIIWATVVFLVTAVTWANFAELDEVARAEGRVIPSSEVQIVQNLEGGILAEILVQTGDSVSAGENLIRIDDTRFASSFNEGKLSLHALQARVARLNAELEGVSFAIPADVSEFDRELYRDELLVFSSRQNELKSSLDILQQQLMQQRQALAELEREETKLRLNADLARKEYELTAPLVETGAVSQVELLRLQIAVNESQGKLEVTRLTIAKAESVVAEALEKIEERRRQFVTVAQAELTEAKRELERLEFSNVALADRVQRTEVRSPVDGTVKRILVNTVGSVIQPGMDLIEIVPSNDSLLVEARIRPSDVAFIHPGQSATVKITAYDYAIYGGLDAVLELISADSITDEQGNHFFEIRVRTNRNHLGSDSKQLPIIPGMVASVDIMTGKKTVMDYLLKPLKRAQANALSER